MQRQESGHGVLVERQRLGGGLGPAVQRRLHHGHGERDDVAEPGGPDGHGVRSRDAGAGGHGGIRSTEHEQHGTGRGRLGGGALATADGNFSLSIGSGLVPSGSTLAVTEAFQPPTGLAAASSVFTLSGAKLAKAQVATLRYNAGALGGLSAQRLSAYEEGSGGTWVFSPTAVQASAGTVQVDVPGPGTLVVAANPQQFTDVPSCYWARGSSDTLLGASVVHGYADGTFQPDGTLTRADFVKMLVLTLGLSPSTTATVFTDVPADQWYAPYVSAAVQAGLVEGLTATTFGPNAPPEPAADGGPAGAGAAA